MRRMNFKRTLFLAFALLIFATPIAAIAEEAQRPDDENVNIHAVPPILDPHFRHRKKGQLEISPYGGSNLGASLSQTWIAGSRLYLHLNNTYAIGANYSFSTIGGAANRSMGGILEDDILHYLNAEAMISNDVAMRVGSSLIEMDLYMTLGVGGIFINTDWQPMGVAGGGVKVYTGIPWLAVRVDVNNYIHPTQHRGSTAVDCDVTFTGGISFLFPSNPSPYETKKR